MHIYIALYMLVYVPTFFIQKAYGKGNSGELARFLGILNNIYWRCFGGGAFISASSIVMIMFLYAAPPQISNHQAKYSYIIMILKWWWWSHHIIFKFFCSESFVSFSMHAEIFIFLWPHYNLLPVNQPTVLCVVASAYHHGMHVCGDLCWSLCDVFRQQNQTTKLLHGSLYEMKPVLYFTCYMYVKSPCITFIGHTDC